MDLVIPHKDRLMHLKLPTLKYRRLCGDMTEVFKITHNIYNQEVTPKLRYYPKSNTRVNTSYSITCCTTIHENILSLPIVNIWNSLPNSVVDVDTVCLFKARLDKFWRLECSLLGTKGNVLNG